MADVARRFRASATEKRPELGWRLYGHIGAYELSE